MDRFKKNCGSRKSCGHRPRLGPDGLARELRRDLWFLGLILDPSQLPSSIAGHSIEMDLPSDTGRKADETSLN